MRECSELADLSVRTADRRRGADRPAAGAPIVSTDLLAWVRAALPKGGTLPYDVWSRRHRGILMLLWLQVPALLVFGLSRGYRPSHCLFDAALVAVPAAAAQLTIRRRSESTMFCSVGLMSSSAVLVDLSGGSIEAHFSFFVMVGVITLYQEWRPFLIAMSFVVLHLGIVGSLAPQAVYNTKEAWDHPWTWAGIHGLAIAAMSVACIANWKLNERFQSEQAELAAIVDSSDDAIYGWTADGRISSWNKGAAKLYGYGCDEMIGKPFSKLIPPNRAEEALGCLDRVRQGEHVNPSDTEGVRSSGDVVPLSVTMSPVWDLTGTMIGGATIARDVTERTRTEQALRFSEERIRGLIETAHDAFVGMDGAGLITDWNHSAEVAFGWSRHQVLGRPLAETIIPARDRGIATAGIERYLSTGEVPNLDGPSELRGLHRDGHEFPVEVAIWRMTLGAGTYVGASFRDITERKREEAKLQQTLSLLGATIESTADGILVVAPDDTITSFNGKFTEMWHLPPSVLELGRADAVVAYVLDQLEEPQAFLSRLHEVQAAPEAETKDILYCKDGRVFERASKPQRVGGTVVGRVWSFHDLTERTRLESDLAAARDEALETSRLKSEFLATMSHEIRTPMNGVIGLTGLLLDTPLSRTQLQYAEGVRTASDALLAIINDILDFSKIEAGKMELEVVDFDLVQALHEVVALETEQATAKGLGFSDSCSATPGTMVRGDVGRLRQILLNLLSNAVKFTHTGTVSMRSVLREGPAAGQVLLHVDIIDTGIGIEAGVVARLFEPFSQADSSTTRRYGGTGLGLAICRRLAEAMDGTITVNSVVGQGSTFSLDIPLQWAREGDISRESAERSGLQGLCGLRALIVDDNEMNRLGFASEILRWGISADLAPNASVALEYLRRGAAASQPYQIALVNMCLPEMNGLEFGRVVNADPALTSVRLVLLTSADVDPEAVARAGFMAYVTKPARLSQIHDALVRAVSPPIELRREPVSEYAEGANGWVLVVEDNPINQVVARGMLARRGYGCDLAGNGIEALKAFARRSYDAIFMDCQMPEMDGYQAAGEIRRREGGVRHVPIIAMTAGALIEDRAKCLAAGMDDYMSKPVKGAELDRVLLNWSPARLA